MSEFSIPTTSEFSLHEAFSAEARCRPAEAFSVVGNIIAPATSVKTAARTRRRGEEHRFKLVFCPEMPCGTHYKLIRRCADGIETTLYEGLLDAEAPSLNLAKVRYRGARLGASEVLLVPPDPSTRLVSLEP
ncbi:MAG: hypothetical protein JNM89_05000 [Hyphomicrobiaceae bacterium]|nr:hypothetical protein [Hyphomicrobiaceae bacterium]